MMAMFSPTLSRGPFVALLAAGIACSNALVAAAFILVISAAPASAHTALVRITPGADAQLTTAPTKVLLEFSEPVSETFATVVVRNPAGVSVTRGKPTVMGTSVTQPLSTDLASGGYLVAYRLVSGDGHAVSGESRFTLTLIAAQSPAPVGVPHASASASRAPATPSVPALSAPPAQDPKPVRGGWLSRFLVPIAGAVGLMVLGGSVLRWDRQRR